MNSKIRYWIVLLSISFYQLSGTLTYAGPEDFQLAARNIIQTAPNRLEFDLFILDTDPLNDFWLSTEQFGILFNSAIYAGGSVSASIVNTNSQLGPFQQIYQVPAIETNAAYSGQTLITLVGNVSYIPLGQCTLVSKASPGTLITHFILTSTVNFDSNTTPELTFTSSSAVNPLYATRVSVSDGTSVSDMIITPGVNAIVDGNPALNAAPAQPGPISGSAVQCSGVAGQIYSVEEVATATSYNWTLPAGWGITAGNTTNSITVTTGLSGGTISVTASNANGTSIARTMDVTVNVTPLIPDQSQTISSGGTFNLTPSGAPAGTTYTWPVPTYTNGVTGGEAQLTGATSISGTLSILSGTGTAIYTVTPRNGTCTGNTFPLTVTVNSTCVPVVISANPVNAAMCTGGSTSLTVTATGTSPVYQWQYNNAGTWVSVTNSTPAGATYTGTNSSSLGISGISAAGAYEYRCNVTNCGGLNNVLSNPATLTVNAVPTITGTTPGSNCGPGTVTLGAVASAGTINWYAASTGGTSLGTGTSFATPGLSSTTTYYVDATNNSCTTETRTAVIATINPLPVTTAVTGSATPVCSSTGNVYSVTSTAGSSYAWTVPAGSIITAGSGTNSITVTFGTTSGNVTVTETNAAGCAGTTVTRAITLLGCGLDADFTGAPLTVCAGSTVTFTNASAGASGAASYSWNFGAGANPAAATGPGPHAVTYSTSGSKTVSLTVTEGATSIETKTNYVTVNPLPVTSAITGSATPACSSTGNVYSVTATAGSSYAWTVPAGSIITSGSGTNSITVTFGTTSGNITVTETSAASCAGAASTLYVSLMGCGLDADFVGSPRTLCAGSQVLFANTSLGTTSGTAFLWNFGDGASPATANTAGPHTVTYSTGGTKTVTLTITEGASNTETKADYITVNPLPGAAGTITGPASVCTGQTGVTYTVPAIPNATSYIWNYSGSGATITGTTNSITMSFGALAQSGALTVRGNNSCGTGTVSTAYLITVNPLPTPPTVGIITQPTCSVATGSVALSGLPAAGTWTLTRSPGGGTVTGTGTTYTVTGLPAGTHTFTVTNASGCTSTASAAIAITAPPAVPTAPVLGTVTQPTCAVTTGSVGISGLPPTGNWTLTRNPGGTEVTGSGTTFAATGIPAGTYTYTVTNSAGCISSASSSFTVNASLPVPTAPVQTVDCTQGFNQAVITVTSPTGTGYEYRLDAGGWQTSGSFSNVANGTHTVTVRNASGCTATGPEFSVNCGCVNPPLLTLGATAGNTCGITALTVNGNTFGGSATSVTIAENGGGNVTPVSPNASPFAFTYTPTAADAGSTVVITVTTNNPVGGLCTAASATYTLTVNALPVAPVPGTVTQPTCAVPSGSVVLNSLPASGDWTITRTPGGQTTTGSGISTTITGLAPGTYNFTVTNANGCVSAASPNVIINAQPDTPAAPIIGTATQPTCALSTGSVALSGLPATGTWTLTRIPGNISITGTGATRIVSAIPSGTYTFTVANAAGCVSPASAEVVINPQPVTPSAPLIGTITHPTCEQATGSIVLEYLPEAGEWTLIRYPGATTLTGSGSSVTISSLPAGTYNFVVRNADGCASAVSANAVINTQPATPTAPVVGTITHPTFQVGTGSVVLSGLPSSGTWTLIRYPDGFTSQGTGTSRTVSGLEPGTYTFAVTNAAGCTSVPSANVVINARPGAPNVIINNPPTICENQTTDLTLPAVTAGSDPNLTFSYWTDAAATVTFATPQAAQAGTYYIMGTSTAEYFTIRPVIVTADELPVANAGLDQVLDYLFGTTLNAEIPEIGTGIWALVSGTGDLFNSAAPSTAVSGLSTGENVFSWTVTNGACDPVTDLIMVTVNDLRIPTLITPNDDGYNDRFELHGIETLGTTELVIFDRRGLKVWESRRYENDWDGRDFNSNPLPEDTYFWVIRADNGVSRSGYIVIRR